MKKIQKLEALEGTKMYLNKKSIIDQMVLVHKVSDMVCPF